MASVGGPRPVAVAAPQDAAAADKTESFDGITGLHRFCLRVATPDPARFRIRRMTERLGSLRLSAVEVSPLQLLSPYEPGTPTIAILRRGTADVRIDGRMTTLGSGEAIGFQRLDARMFTSRSASAWFTITATEPKPWHREMGAVRRVGELSAPLLALTQATMAAIRGGVASTSELRHLERAVSHVLDGLVADSEPDDLPGLDSTLLRRRALALIEDGYTDAELRSAAIARALNVSLRTLQRAYEEATGGLTVSDEIARCRREHAARILEDPSLTRLPIASVAERSGYARQAGLRRAFATHYGMSPSEYRALHTAGQ
ncbi:helix-turn-helix transcriptional regulator [Microbacteriaceae bacterium VKM Ac-2854]|nr:helix-turn-helix transcriptional regulator [Microbacteriaceae bacterium VKM Ac-2854]